MAYNKGQLLETKIVQLLNENKVEKLPQNLKDLVQFIFPNCQDNDIVRAEVIEGTMKPDFSITVGEETHYISMKSGVNNIVHQEYIKNYIRILRGYGFSETILRAVLFFQYGDGTYNGTGKERMSYATLRKKLEKAFVLANEELNKNRKAVIELVDRFLFKGSHEEYIAADYIYHGDTNSGTIVSRSQIMKHLEYRDWNFLEALHIGPILFRPHARYYKTDIKKESYRARVEFYWPNFLNDLNYIKSHYLP